MELWTVARTAKWLGLSPSSVYGLIAKELLEAHRLGVGRGTLRVLPADAQAYLDRCRIKRKRPEQPDLNDDQKKGQE